MAKPTPTLPPLPLGSAIAVLIPISLPLLSSSTPPEFPGLIAASVWMMPRSVVPLEAYDPSLGDASSRPRPEMIPVDIEWSSPKGFPRAYVFCPTCRPADEPSVTGFRALTTSGGASSRSTATSLSGSPARKRADQTLLSISATLISSAPRTTW